jgi:Ca-activated chloride channel family protein
MFSSDKLSLVQQAFKMMTEALNPEDRISIVTYAGSDTVALDGAYGYEKAKIMAVIDDLHAGGATAGADGINSAYRLAEKHFIQGGNNRVILATDGDFNVGVSDNAGLEKLISEKRQSGVYFSVFGVGHGNLQAEKMETLALNGNGTYSYIDSVKEARKALVEGIGGSIVTVAKDVKAGITFNPDYVESFRLIGYENKLLTEDEFNDENTDAGELGSGHTVTVVYEIKLTENASLDKENAEKIADVVIKYKPTENVGADAQEEKQLTLCVMNSVYNETPTDEDLFVASVIEFGLILRDSEYKANANLAKLLERLSSLDLANDEFKREFCDIVSKHLDNLNKQ